MAKTDLKAANAAKITRMILELSRRFGVLKIALNTESGESIHIVPETQPDPAHWNSCSLWVAGPWAGSMISAGGDPTIACVISVFPGEYMSDAERDKRFAPKDPPKEKS